MAETKRVIYYDQLDNNRPTSGDVIFVDNPTTGTHKMDLKSFVDAINNGFDSSIKSSGVSVSADNYSSIITNVNDQPVNSIYTYGAGLQSKVSNLPSNKAMTIINFAQKSTGGLGQVMLAIERNGSDDYLYFRTIGGSPAVWSSWVKMANNSDVEAVREALDNLDIETDKTLSIADKPADAKAAGDEISDIRADLSFKTTSFANATDIVYATFTANGKWPKIDVPALRKIPYQLIIYGITNTNYERLYISNLGDIALTINEPVVVTPQAYDYLRITAEFSSTPNILPVMAYRIKKLSESEEDIIDTLTEKVEITASTNGMGFCETSANGRWPRYDIPITRNTHYLFTLVDVNTYENYDRVYIPLNGTDIPLTIGNPVDITITNADYLRVNFEYSTTPATVPSIAYKLVKYDDSIASIHNEIAEIVESQYDYKLSRLTHSMFEQGGLKNGDGTEYDITAYIRTEFIAVNRLESLIVLNDTNDLYFYSIHQYDNNKNWIGALTTEEKKSVRRYILKENCEYVRFVVLRNGYGRIIPTDIDDTFINLVFEFGYENDDLSLLNAQHVAGNTSANPLTLLHFSDLHGDTIALSRIVNHATLHTSYINDMICTGDMVPNTAETIDSWWNSSIMTCIGNHETASYSQDTGYNWTALSMADRDSYYIAPFESSWGIVHSSGTSYYYKDYSSQNVRLIVMDSMLYVDNGQEATEQTNWLESLLSDAITNGLHVLIAIHSPHGGAIPKTSSFTRYLQTTMPVNADCDTPQIVINKVASAINDGLHFVGYIVGHTHQDNIWDATGDGSQLMYCITCAAVTQKAQWINSDQYRSMLADAYNLITIDTTHTLIKIIRGGGACIDDHMRTRKAICIDYSTGTIVGEVL